METLLTSTFTVALAEIGDKTQLLSLLLITRFKAPWSIILGILVATLLNHAASAWLGVWLSQFLMSQAGQWLISGSFILVGLWLLIPDKDEQASSAFDHYGAFIVSLCLFFLAEIGDKTQVATVLLGAQFSSVFLVTTGTTLGMLLANIPVIFAGKILMDKIPFKTFRILAALAFVATGIYLL